MWEKVSSRAHRAIKIFPFGPHAAEVMLYGTVAYGLKDGGEKKVDWAARAELVKDEKDGKVRLAFYQVYLVSLVEWSWGLEWEERCLLTVCRIRERRRSRGFEGS